MGSGLKNGVEVDGSMVGSGAVGGFDGVKLFPRPRLEVPPLPHVPSSPTRGRVTGDEWDSMGHGKGDGRHGGPLPGPVYSPTPSSVRLVVVQGSTPGEKSGGGGSTGTTSAVSGAWVLRSSSLGPPLPLDHSRGPILPPTSRSPVRSF